jgi:hypothetical protein
MTEERVTQRENSDIRKYEWPLSIKILTSPTLGYSIHNYWPFLEFKYPLFPFELKIIGWIMKKEKEIRGRTSLL